MAPKPDSRFLPEIWSLFAVGSLWVVMRFAVRLRVVGLYGLGIDDGFAFIALFCWAVIIAGIHCTHFTHTSMDYEPDEVWALSPSQVKGVSWGTKFYIITLYAYITMVFSLKAIVIILYRRLASERWQKRLLYFTIFLCVAGWTATNLMLSLMCLPYNRRWVVQPQPPEVCTASPTFFILLSCFNATTDALLLAIPVPILWTLRIPLHRRIGVFILLASGIFVLAACITRVALTVVPGVTVSVIARWGARELSIALVAVNTAALRPMFRKPFWHHTPSAGAQQRRPSGQRRDNYMFQSLQRKYNHRRFASLILRSKSAGASTIERFARGTECPTIWEDSGCDVTTPPPPAFLSASARRAARWFEPFGSLGRSTLGVTTLNRVQSADVESGIGGGGVIGTVVDVDDERRTEANLEKEKGSRVSATLVREDSGLRREREEEDEIRRYENGSHG